MQHAHMIILKQSDKNVLQHIVLKGLEKLKSL